MSEQGEKTAEPGLSFPVVRRDGGRLGSALSAAALLALVGLLFLGLLGPGWRSPPALIAGPVLVLPYLFMGLSAVGFALWSAMPDRNSLAMVTLLPLLYALVAWGPSWASRGEEITEDRSLRVMNYNVRRLWGAPDDEKPSAACVGDVLETHQPDVITLLEVSRNDIDGLAQQFGLTCRHTSYRKSDSADVGGLAVCTRGERWSLVGAKGTRYRDDMDWYYLFSEVQRGEKRVNVLAVHLYPYSFFGGAFRRNPDILDLGRNSVQVVKSQGAQSAALLERVSRFEDPTILAGDFNSTRDFALHSALRRHLTDVWERGGFGFGATVDFFGWLPLRVDYVYASRELAVGQATVGKAACSDHRPVITELVLRE